MILSTNILSIISHIVLQKSYHRSSHNSPISCSFFLSHLPDNLCSLLWIRSIVAKSHYIIGMPANSHASVHHPFLKPSSNIKNIYLLTSHKRI